MQVWWCTTYQKETPAKAFSCKLSEIFEKIYFVEHIRADAWMKWTKKNCVQSIRKKTPVNTSFLVHLQTCGVTAFPKETPSQMLFYRNCEVLQKVIFTEHCCATASDFLLHFQFITCFVSNKSVHSELSCLGHSEKRSVCSGNSLSKTQKTSLMVTFGGWGWRDKQKDILQKQSPGHVLQKRCSRIFGKFYRKTPVQEPIFKRSLRL